MPKNDRIRINTKNINIRTNPELLELVRVEAKADGIKASRWIRDCLVKELKKCGYHMDEIIPIVQYLMSKFMNFKHLPYLFFY